jgi:hypothetical protein
VKDDDKMRLTEWAGYNAHLSKQVQDMHRTWLERLRDIRHLESDFGMKLMTAKTPSEVASVCGEWMAKHVETIAHEQRTFANAWLRMIVDMMGWAAAGTPQASERDHKSVE